MTGHYRYRPATLTGDYVRAAVGATMCVAPLAFVAVNVFTWLLAAVGGLFVAFGVRTAIRHGTEYVLDEHGLGARGPLGSRVDWSTMRGLRLAYYATRRDRQGGWMQMNLRGASGTIRIDSALEGFDEIARAAAAGASAHGVALSAATLANFAAMDIVVPGTEGSPT